jgi:hypothetical protein
LIGKANINISTALAYNLMGALFGGLMEYNSMYFGFAFLYLLAIGFYFLAWTFFSDTAATTDPKPRFTPLVKAMASQIRSIIAIFGI